MLQTIDSPYRYNNLFVPQTVITTVMTCRYTVQSVVINRTYEGVGLQVCNNV